LDIFGVADALRGRGWFVDKQGPPPSLHMTMSAVHETTVADFIADLDRVLVDSAATTRLRSTGPATYGTVE
jgi:hypothetical protein